jgi:4-hydroxy-2-oxoheptanedioate aldolase
LAVAAARFAPEGRRGANPYVRAASYSADARFFAEANERAACLALVEGKEGVEAIDAILAVPGLDAVFVGPVDLSAALGVPGEPEHPAVVSMVRDVVERGRDLGVATAVFAPTPEAARRWLDLGVRLVALSVDTGLMLEGFRAALAEVR